MSKNVCIVDKTFHIMFTVTFIEHYSLQKIFFKLKLKIET